MKLGPAAKTFKSANLYELRFNRFGDDNLKVAVVQDKQVVTKSIVNPGALKITATTVLNYEAPAQNKPGFMIVKIDGSGFIPPPRLTLDVEGAIRNRLVYVSPTEVIVRVTRPEIPVVITLTDTLTGASVSTVIQRPPAQPGATPNP